MSRLKKGSYGVTRGRAGLFGLFNGQMRGGPKKLTHNSGWYNRKGQKLGWGDLSADDFKRIAGGLKKGELFVILGERDSFWNFVTAYGNVGANCTTSPEEKAPGRDYIAEKAMYVIAPGRLCLVDHSGFTKESRYEIAGLTFDVISGDEARKLIFGKN
jgi:hypothetical protein